MSALVFCCTCKGCYFLVQFVVNPVHTLRNINDQNTVPHATSSLSVRCLEDENNSESGVTMLRELPVLQSNQKELQAVGWKILMGLVWWLTECNRTTPNLSDFGFCKCEGMMATGQQYRSLIDFNGTTQLFQVKSRIYQLQTLIHTV